MAPINTLISPNPYAVVLNQYSNFATGINNSNDAVLGDFWIGPYAEKARFNATGTRLYVTDRFKDEVRVFVWMQAGNFSKSRKYGRAARSWNGPPARSRPDCGRQDTVRGQHARTHNDGHRRE